MGGLAGGILLLYVSEQVFHMLVPVLILLAAVLLAVQDRVRDWIRLHSGHDGTDGRGCRSAALPVGLSAVYGGYFGPGLSVIILAVLGLFLDDTLTRLNALKQCISLGTNVAAAVFFLFSGLVLWPFALVMAAGALFGGAIGGRIAEPDRPGPAPVDHRHHRDCGRAVLPCPVVHLTGICLLPCSRMSGIKLRMRRVCPAPRER